MSSNAKEFKPNALYATAQTGAAASKQTDTKYMTQFADFKPTMTETELKSTSAPFQLKNSSTDKPVVQTAVPKSFNTNAKVFVPGGAKTATPATATVDQKDVKSNFNTDKQEPVKQEAKPE